VYWGAAEPLSRAVAIPPVLALAKRGVRVTFLTFEHPEDRANTELMAELAQTFRRAGVRWLRVPYHHKPQAPATAFDLLQGALKVLSTRGWRRYDIVHGRTLVGGLLGGLLAPLLGAKFLFANEGYYADERVDSGTWTVDTPSYKAARWAEHAMYARADAILPLSDSSLREIAELPHVAGRGVLMKTARPAVDKSRFAGLEPARWVAGEPLRLLYAGTVGGEGAEVQPGVANRYRLDEIGRFVARARESGVDARLRVLTIAPPEVVRGLMEKAGLSQEAWSVAKVPAEAIPGEMAQAHAGMHFMEPGRSAHAGAPTKVGEYWAAGLPIVVTPGIGDAGTLAPLECTGVAVADHSPEAHARGLAELLELLGDPSLSERCRRAADEHYGLDRVIDTHLELYHQLLGRKT
jgi:glycosyltransferase involved in cell wall biosynthesis